MPRPIRVMQVMGYMGGGGVEATIMNHYRLIDHTRLQFDFVIQDNSPVVPEEEITSLGGHIYRIPAIKNLPQYMHDLHQLITRTRPNIVHSNVNALSVLPLGVAKHAGVPIRIAHSHSTANKKELLRTVTKDALRPFSRLNPTELAACGVHSAQWLFGEKAVKQGRVHYIKNAVDLERFSFNQASREKLRKEFGLSDQFVIGQVGRFSKQKNQLFSIRVFRELLSSIPNAVLVFLGIGNTMREAKKLALELGIADSVRFVGVRDDVANWYSAFDTLLLPSLYEGLGMVAIEAQSTGLPILASNYVPQEAFVAHDLIHVLSLKDSPRVWANQIAGMASNPLHREDRHNQLSHAGYDIHQSAHDLQDWYLQLLKKHQS